MATRKKTCEPTSTKTSTKTPRKTAETKAAPATKAPRRKKKAPSASGPYIMTTGLVTIEWSSDETWEGKIPGWDGVIRGDSPCTAAEAMLRMVQEVFGALGKYGVPVEKILEHPPLQAALGAFAFDVERAHSAAHEAHARLKAAASTNSLN